MLQQRTLKSITRSVGLGVHSGQKVEMVFKPAPPDSLGAYLSAAPAPGLADSQRNCVSNIRPEGLGYAEAARKIAWLLVAARQLGATGVVLKDRSDSPALPAGPDPCGTIGE